ncbi:thermonuclease family protein [Dyadobacter tibetensis]|uniref:thermonuclease family protein n=1 Tax=Dyadobacter tibetensis TaxID=1211851 RepID=UPI0004726A82|nr:thermonuclease family protein [Dyadobacter tibetensis]
MFASGSCGQSISSTSRLPQPLIAEVIAIQDGDTIELKLLYTGKGAGQRTGKPLRIRFLHINCPERGKPYYKVAKQYVSDRCFRQKVEIRHENKFDRYGRLLGEVVLSNGEVLNKTLVQKGLAVHFKKYSSDKNYDRLEQKAQSQKIGIWSLEPVNLGK